MNEETEYKMFQRLQKMWHPFGSGGYSELGIICPYCEYTNGDTTSYVHFEGVKHYSGNDHYDAQHQYEMGVRGDVTVLSFWCEFEGHKWVLVLGEHKGSIRAKIILTNEESSPHFNSPIEQAFWDAWIHADLPPEFILVPQYQIGKYYVDFAHLPTKTVIELDGFVSHSSTDDIAKDRQRQRYIELQGWHVIRFGGKEIHLDAGKCGQETFHLLLDRMNNKDKS